MGFTSPCCLRSITERHLAIHHPGLGDFKVQLVGDRGDSHPLQTGIGRLTSGGPEQGWEVAAKTGKRRIRKAGWEGKVKAEKMRIGAKSI